MLNFSYDEWSDTLTIEGVRYSGELFRMLGMGPRQGQLLKILKKEHDVVTVQSVQVNEIDFEMWYDRQEEKRRLALLRG